MMAELRSLEAELPELLAVLETLDDSERERLFMLALSLIELWYSALSCPALHYLASGQLALFTAAAFPEAACHCCTSQALARGKGKGTALAN
jgi:hypothetical protein